MQHAFNQLLQFLQQGIAAIFHFVQIIWTWSVAQISALLAVPWQQWPWWKEILLVVVIVGVIWALFTAAIELFRAGERILIAFAALLSVLVRTLPSIVLAGLIALGGAWAINHLDNNLISLPLAFNQSSGTSTSAPSTAPTPAPSAAPTPAPNPSPEQR
jgi:hypothetical protein